MLEEAFHVQISPETMEQLTSVACIVSWLEEQEPVTGTRP
jgi:acyl carrier protein